jgi:hypothetical protein
LVVKLRADVIRVAWTLVLASAALAYLGVSDCLRTRERPHAAVDGWSLGQILKFYYIPCTKEVIRATNTVNSKGPYMVL